MLLFIVELDQISGAVLFMTVLFDTVSLYAEQGGYLVTV